MKKKGKCEVCPCGCQQADEVWYCPLFGKKICDVCCYYDMDGDDYMGIKDPRRLCVKLKCPVCIKENLAIPIWERPGSKVVYLKKGFKFKKMPHQTHASKYKK